MKNLVYAVICDYEEYLNNVIKKTKTVFFYLP